ncbi:hypothetical protein [Aestuariivivens sp. NBU2969]|uniref:hypothetical protein n=1 Tax=Aestuariivivens sp. NBU2969 TaxID=2873267 RepID=UPI001CBE6FCF|nr:hypothetical protein [Aestuariivivens sp. NBU2969]
MSYSIGKRIIQIVIGLLVVSCSPTKTVVNNKTDIKKEKTIYYDFAGKLTAVQLFFIKNSYNWDNEKILIINYRQPISSCHFDNNKITSGGKNWWKDFYSKINTENCLNINVLANGERVKKKLDNIYYFDDKNDFFLLSY